MLSGSPCSLPPAYLKTIPNYPFALNAPLRYRRAGANYVLYSIGPDGIDDGGRAIFHAPTIMRDAGELERDYQIEAQRSRYFIDTYSKGDIVAGVNVY